MSDWEFLHEMKERGCSAEEIVDAAASGAAPWEWETIDRDWIDSQFQGEMEDHTHSFRSDARFRSRDGFPFSSPAHAELFSDLVDCAERHFQNTGRYLQIWGELGEIYAEIQFGLRRHRTREAGSDGTIAGKLVEVKTISPEKTSAAVLVKRQGNFEQLLIVRISRDFRFQGRLLDRSELRQGFGKFLRGRFKVASDLNGR